VRGRDRVEDHTTSSVKRELRLPSYEAWLRPTASTIPLLAVCRRDAGGVLAGGGVRGAGWTGARGGKIERFDVLATGVRAGLDRIIGEP
jgi:hypothetical protein